MDDLKDRKLAIQAQISQLLYLQSINAPYPHVLGTSPEETYESKIAELKNELIRLGK